MTDSDFGKMMLDADRRRAVNAAAIRDRRPLPGESTGADERHYAEGYSYACGYWD